MTVLTLHQENQTEWADLLLMSQVLIYLNSLYWDDASHSLQPGLPNYKCLDFHQCALIWQLNVIFKLWFKMCIEHLNSCFSLQLLPSIYGKKAY